MPASCPGSRRAGEDSARAIASWFAAWRGPAAGTSSSFAILATGKRSMSQRLVGLPGESIEVKAGGVWIDGNRLRPPPEIANLKCVSADDFSLFAQEGSPCSLVATNSSCSAISRRSPTTPASGTIPRKDILGVVGVVYFPPLRVEVLPRH